MYRDPEADPPTLAWCVGSTTLRYHLGAIDDLHAMLVERGDWVSSVPPTRRRSRRTGTGRGLGSSRRNPVGGWYGLRKGYRGRFGMYLPPLLEDSGSSSSSTTRATTGYEPSSPAQSP